MHCQKCRTSLELDASLSDLNPAAFNLLVGASHISTQAQSRNALPSKPTYPPERKILYDQVSQDATQSGFQRGLLHRSASPENKRSVVKDSQAMSFHMLSESEMVVPTLPRSPEAKKKNRKSQQVNHTIDVAKDDTTGAMSAQMEKVNKLFEVLSAKSDIDHPICIECTELLVEGLQKRLEAATKERDAYVGFLKQVKISVPTEDEVNKSLLRLKKAQASEAAALEELLQLEKEREAVDMEIETLEKEARALDIEEEKFWRERNDFGTRLADFQNVRDSVNLKFDHDSHQLEKLQRTNVYNDTFCISHDGSFGTINGLRLGRLSSIPVDWPEINAAWGYTILLLATVADRLSFKFEDYELQPMGSTSRITKVDLPSPALAKANTSRRSVAVKKHILELYSSGDMPLGLPFMHRKFDNAMVAFLECMRQLGAFVEAETTRIGRPIKLPYKIEGEKIGDISIKLGFGFNNDDDWSKACKFTLTCCKFLLAHASNLNMSSRRNGA